LLSVAVDYHKMSFRMKRDAAFIGMKPCQRVQYDMIAAFD